MEALAHKSFRDSRSPKGKAWKPLAFRRPNGGNKPLRDTGRLMASLTASHNDSQARVGTNLVSAPLHQYGGTVRPKKGKYLAIPLTKEAKRAGTPRAFRNLGMAGKTLVQKQGTGAKAKTVAQFALVKSVKIPARPFMGISPDLKKRLAQLFQDAIRDLATRGGR